MREQAKPHWLAGLLGSACAAMLAYCTAVFVNFALISVVEGMAARVPAPLRDAGLSTALFVILLLIAITALAIPFFQRDWDSALRKYSLFSTVFLCAYVVLHAAGPVDPDLPLDLLVKYVVEPLKSASGVA